MSQRGQPADLLSPVFGEFWRWREPAAVRAGRAGPRPGKPVLLIPLLSLDQTVLQARTVCPMGRCALWMCWGPTRSAVGPVR